jgi:hypothetical protein
MFRLTDQFTFINSRRLIRQMWVRRVKKQDEMFYSVFVAAVGIRNAIHLATAHMPA